MNFGFVWLSTRKDLARRARDPWAFAIWLGMPLIVVSLILLAFGGGSGRAPVAHVFVEDADSSLVSGLVVQALQRVPVIEPEGIAVGTGRARMDAGEASALVQIPKGFAAAVIEGRDVTLPVWTNPAQRILPGIVVETLSVLADAGFYLHRLFGDELKTFMGGPPAGRSQFSDALVAKVSAQLNAKIGRLSRYVSPPLIQLDTRVESTQQTPSRGLGEVFFPGILFMALLFMATGAASDVWIEKERGTLRRALSSPQRVSDFFGGKILAGGVTMAVVSLAGLLIGAAGFGIPIGVVPLALLWATFVGFVFLTLITLIHVHASSARTAGVFTTMIVFPLLMIGGSFFPFEAMPPGLAAIGRMTPNGWALTQMETILAANADPGRLAVAFGVLAVTGALSFWLCSRRMRRDFATG